MKAKRKKLIMIFILLIVVAIGLIIWNSKYVYIVRINHYIKENNIPKIEKLLKNPKDINFSFSILDTGYSIVSPIEQAAWYGNPEIVEMLIENGANGDSIAITGESALRIACMSTRYDYETKMKILKLLLDAGADVNKNEVGTPYGKILSIHGSEEYKNYNDTDEGYPNIQKEKLEILKLFILHGLDIDELGCGYLSMATKYGTLDVVRYFIEELDFDVNIRIDEYDTTLLMYAGKYGTIDTAKYLLENGADKNLKTTDGWTALRFAVQYNHEEVIKLLNSYD